VLSFFVRRLLTVRVFYMWLPYPRISTVHRVFVFHKTIYNLLT